MALVYAGLFPQLHRQGNWLTVAFRPGREPFKSLSKAIIPLLYEDELTQIGKIRELTEQFSTGVITLKDTIEWILQKHPEVKNFLLFIDQFEELYTLRQSEQTCRWTHQAMEY